MYRPSLLLEKYFICLLRYVVLEECELRHCSVMSEKYIDLEVYKSKDASNFTDSIVYICVSWMICCHM